MLQSITIHMRFFAATSGSVNINESVRSLSSETSRVSPFIQAA